MINFKLFILTLIVLPFSSSLFAKNENIDQTQHFLSQNTRTAAFEENRGQVYGLHDGAPQPEVRFTYNVGTAKIFLMRTGLAYQFAKMHFPEGYGSDKEVYDHKNRKKHETLRKQVRTETYRMDMELINADPDARITTEGMSSDYVNYYNRDVLNVYSYTKVTYHDIYPGINWVIYTAADNALKYDLVVRPGADPTQIRMRFSHTEEVKLDPDGNLHLGNRLGSITEKKPVSYAGAKAVGSRFVLEGNELHFAIDTYDTSQTLIIDPVLHWATYYGGSGQDFFEGSAADAAGNVYLAGFTSSLSGIALGGHQNTGNGSWDAFLVKFNSAGVRQWATYYGASAYGYSCATDATGNVYLSGQTDASSGIASSGHQNTHGGGSNDAFLVKFNSAGVRQWATYYGGNDDDYGYFCTTDVSGNVYLAGMTFSSSGIASSGHQNTHGGGILDAFLVKFNSSGVRQWATYYGGSGLEEGRSCTTDAIGNVYLTGVTQSSSGIASSGHQDTYGGGWDAFLVKFNSAGVRQWATYYGGSGNDLGRGCATDATGNIYLAGTTPSSSNIASGGHQNTHGGGGLDAFLVKFNSSGVRQWATYYGGNGSDLGFSCTPDAVGNVYLAGSTQSSSGIASGGHQNTHGGSFDAFLVKFNSVGVRQWGTYYGGSGSDNFNTCVIDAAGNVYSAGETQSVSGIASGGHQNIYGGGYHDAFLVKFVECDPAPTHTLNETICQGQSYTFNGNSYTTPQSGLTATFQTASGCDSIVTLNLAVTPAITHTLNETICQGQSYTFNGNSYTTPQSGLTATFQNAGGCDSVVTLNLAVTPAITHTLNETICQGQSYTFNGNNYTTPQSGLTATFQTASGCDSFVILNLAVTSALTQNIDTVVCNELIFGGQRYIENTTVSDTVRNSSGCDSIIRNLHVRIEKLDLFINLSPENSYETELLTLTVSEDAGTDFTVLSWLPAEFFLNNSTGKTQQITINGPQNIRSIGITRSGVCTDTASIYIVPRPYSKDIGVPTAFTPNGDNKNDIFMPVLLLDRAYSIPEFRILNRWGQTIYSASGTNTGWDGTSQGLPVEQGVYFYIIKIRFADGSEKVLQGDVTLIR